MRACAQLPTLRAMLKTALSAIVVVAAFAGALYAGGNVMGAWEPYDAAEPAAGGPKAAAPKRTRRKHARPVRQVRDARWIRRANALCEAALREGAETRAPRTAEELAAFLKRGVKQNRAWNRRFLALGSPRGGARQFARIRGLFREDETLVADLLTAVRRHDGASAMLLGDRLMSLARRESALLVGLGARECALPSNAI
jgi:hypothetical protein